MHIREDLKFKQMQQTASEHCLSCICLQEKKNKKNQEKPKKNQPHTYFDAKFLSLLNIKDLALPEAIDKVRVLELRNS